MIFSLQSIVTLLITYKYLIIFPIAVIEGPITGVIAAFLVSQGILDIYIVYIILVTADVIGDIIHYYIGRLSSEAFIVKHGDKFGVSKEKIEYVKKQFQENPWRTFIFGKYTHAFNSAILIVAGILKFDFRKFVSINTLLIFPKIIIVMLIGYYFGKSYTLIKTYFDTWALYGFIIIVCVILYWLWTSKENKI